MLDGSTHIFRLKRRNKSILIILFTSSNSWMPSNPFRFPTLERYISSLVKSKTLLVWGAGNYKDSSLPNSILNIIYQYPQMQIMTTVYPK